jgi:hypothetical protein
VTERNISLLLGGELDNSHFDDLLPVEEKDRLRILMKFAFCKLVLPQTFHLSLGTAYCYSVKFSIVEMKSTFQNVSVINAGHCL